MHAHFDCFSGAAGDMMLAACLDAADSLPYPLKLLHSPTTNIDCDDHVIITNNEKNSGRLLSRLVKDLEDGLPELKGEFGLSLKRVWRGLGRIAAMKVDVESIYNHKAAPVPGAQQVLDGGSKEKDHHSHEHTHANTHNHQHAHNDDHTQTDELQAPIDAHHDHQHNSITKDIASLKEDPQNNSNTSHNHNHSHGHSHGHEHSHNHGHSHGHEHSHNHISSGGKLRNLTQIKKMLQSAPSQHIPTHVASLAIEAFTALAHAEMHTHGANSIDEVHFHEVGAVDSIIDTVGTLLALYYLGVDLGNDDKKNIAVTCSALPLGEGNVWTDHGLLPVPAPATMRLMIGMPTCPGPRGVTGELVTPTAAALLRALTQVSCKSYNESSYWKSKSVPGRPPPMIPRAVGIGAGSKDFERHPNVLRLILGDGIEKQPSNSVNTGEIESVNTSEIQTDEKTAGDVERKGHAQGPADVTKKVSENMPNDSYSEEVNVSNDSKNTVQSNKSMTQESCQLWDMHTLTQIQANIDDATPELLAHAIELLLKNGAIDAWVQPIVMKKGRPANTLHCICHCDPSANDVDGTRNEHVDDTSAEQQLLLVLFRHTTTLGVRIQRNILRAELQRKFVEVQLPYQNNVRSGKVDVKISSLNNDEVVSVKAEFDQCKVVSEESGIPLKIVSSAAERIAWDNYVDV